jgi:Cu-Zn family superoxide dismutase
MKRAATICLTLQLVLPGCGGAGQGKAVAELQALGGSGVTGTATFATEGGKVRVEAEVSGLTPGKHGFHIHEWGDCSAPDGMSAGPHFNPEAHDHGAPGQRAHAGDLGNLEADASGKARISLTLDQLGVEAGTRGIVGRGLIVHEQADDLASQPAGDAGARLACGVIHAERGETKPVLAPAT